MPLDGHSTLAVILGASQWPNSPNLRPEPSYEASAADTFSYLRDPGGLNIPAENIRNLFDDASPAGEIDAAVVTFSNSAWRI